MDLAKLERDFSTTTAAVALVDPRLLRRIIRTHRDVSGLKLDVPHTRCYALERVALLAIVNPSELGAVASRTDDGVLLVARPAPRELTGRTPGEVLQRLWRAAFHAGVHLQIDRRFADGALSDALVRERIDRIGQIEFDEVRSALRHDDLVLPPGDDRQTYTEFCAHYLELRYFAPALLTVTFPGLNDVERIDGIVAADVDAVPILDHTKPEGSDPLPVLGRARASTSFMPPPSLGLGRMFAPRAPSPRRRERLRRAAEQAKSDGNDVRAALMRAVVGLSPDCEEELKLARQDLRSLGMRLNAALVPFGDTPMSARDRSRLARGGDVEWGALLSMLATEAAHRRGLRYPVEARLLYDLQLAALAHEKPHRAVDLAGYLLSLTRKPVVRPLPATREIRIARYIHAAQKKVRHARIDSPDRKLLAKALRAASERAELNVRLALRPALLDALSKIGLEPRTGPEKLSRDKVIEEVLDQAVDRGFLSLAHLRDALSRNQLKLEDVKSARELWQGDALMKLDRELDSTLDGVYRKGEVYLRVLQRASALPFGTHIGRLIVLWLLLPAAIAFIALEGLTHLVGPIVGLFSHAQAQLAGGIPLWSGATYPVWITHEAAELHLLSWQSFVGVVLGILLLIHSSAARWAARRTLSLLGTVLLAVLWRVPHWILTRRLVRAFFRTTVVRVLFRRVLLPAGIALPVYLLTPLRDQSIIVAIAVSAAVFLALSWVMSSRLAERVEEFFFDKVAPSWRALSHRVLPGLVRMIAAFFRAMMELVDRGMYKVDELLRFRQGQSKALVWLKAAAGLVWGIFAYIVRLYITLLIEPYINPIKLPITTVAHKLFVPFTPGILSTFTSAFSFLGPVIGGTIAGVTGFFFPSMFGFIAWELKENWKLYRATRGQALTPVLVGSHGETMGGMLVPGFHSGTLPKLYERLRRAAQREEEDARGAATTAKLTRPTYRAEGSRGQFREGLREIEVAVGRFVEREIVALLAQARQWPHGPLEVTGVDLGSNRVRIRLTCPAIVARGGACEIAFEEQSGLVLASVPQPGFLDKLGDRERTVFENALGGFYHFAGVDLVREQIGWAVGRDTPFDVTDEGLVVWPGAGYRTEVVYRFRTLSRRRHVRPKVRGEPFAVMPQSLDKEKLVFAQQTIRWVDWADAWSLEIEPEREVVRLVYGPSILPPRPGDLETAGDTRAPSATPLPPPPRALPAQPSGGAPSFGAAATVPAGPSGQGPAGASTGVLTERMPGAPAEAMAHGGVAPTVDAAMFATPSAAAPSGTPTRVASSAAPTLRREK